MKTIIFFLAVLTATSGCSSLYKADATKFEFSRVDGNLLVYKYISVADIYYPLESPGAEKSRMEWLESWLSDNGLDVKKYKILSRTPIVKLKSSIPNAQKYDIYYEVGVETKQ